MKAAPSASVQATWGNTADGGRALTGYGLLFWREGDPHPNYANALVKGAAARSHTYPGLRPGTYRFRIHACNGANSCGYWTNPPKKVIVPPAPPPTPTPRPPTINPPSGVRDLSFSKDHESFTVRWKEPSNNGGANITGYGILQWRDGTPRPPYSRASTVSGRSKTYPGLRANTKYWVKVHACNGRDRCGPWTSNTEVTTDPTPRSDPTPPGPVRELRHTGSGTNTVTITWKPPATPGSGALSGYHVQHREHRDDPDTGWPRVAAEVTPGSATTHTLRGLVNGTPYDVRVQACNDDPKAECGTWVMVEEAVPGNPVGRARIEVAKRTIDIGERVQVTVYDIPVGKVAYANLYGAIQPEGRCPNRAAAQAAAAAQRFGNPSTGGWYDAFRVEGCADGGQGYIRVTNADESELYASRTITVRGRPTPVRNLTATVGNGQLAITWDAPTSSGNAALRDYQLQYKAQSSGAWGAAVTVALATDPAYTIAKLTNGTTYDVQVRACNQKNLCGAWASTSATPSDGSGPGPQPTAGPKPPVNPQPPSVSRTCEPAPGGTPPTGTVLDTPTDLAVEPMLNRQARLKWANVKYAEGYLIEVRRRIVDRLTGPRWSEWMSPRHRIQSVTTNNNCYSIILNDVLETATKSYGVKNTTAFGLRVVAKSNGAQDSLPAEVIIVDNLITKANGHISQPPSGDTDPPGQVELTWKSVPALLSGNNYSDGDTFFRYRRAQGNHDSGMWVPGSYDAAKTEIANDNTIQPLDRGELYGVQLIYVKSGKPIVFSAEESYVWSSNTAVRHGQRVASLPLRQNLPDDNTYYYRVCDESFDIEGAPRKTQWLALIRDVADTWESATNRLIRTEEETEDCTDYSLVIADVLAEIEREKIRSPGIDKAGLTEHIKAFLGVATNQLGLRPSVLAQVTYAMDTNTSEIILFDDAPGTSAAEVAAEVNFMQIGQRIGYADCWDPEFRGNTRINNALMCAISEPRSDNLPGMTTDIVIYRYAYSVARVKSLEIAPDNPVLHPCVTDRHSAYGGVLHEFGHALGIGDGRVDLLRDVSVMATAQPNCAPYPLDLVAIYALCQHRFP